jgi:hypothetical protein
MITPKAVTRTFTPNVLAWRKRETKFVFPRQDQLRLERLVIVSEVSGRIADFPFPDFSSLRHLWLFQ